MIQEYQAVIINLCDAWQSYTSFRLTGVYTSKLQLKIIIHKLLESDTIELDNEEITIGDLDFNDIERLQNQLKYVNINPINFNQDE